MKIGRREIDKSIDMKLFCLFALMKIRLKEVVTLNRLKFFCLLSFPKESRQYGGENENYGFG